MEDFIFIGRQPILDRKKKIAAYEILYRKSFEDFAQIESDNVATSRVLINIFNNIGIQKLSSGKKTFINVNYDLLFYDIFDFIPSENIVLEILENTPADEKIIERIKDLKEKGFEFALDDFLITSDSVKLLPYVDYVKIDLLQTYDTDLEETVEFLRKYNKKLIAEKVEDYPTFDKTYHMGFDLFQGYFFAQPMIISHKRFDPYEVTLLNLLKELNTENPSIDRIENIIKSDVHMTYNLLKFVNSAYFSLKSKIKNIRHAIMILGAHNLKIWVLLMLYADAKIGGIDSPLLETALLRGKLLETLAKLKSNDINFAEMAFLTGVLSLLDVLLGIPKEEVLSDLNIDEEIKKALINEEGYLGEMLKLCYLLEMEKFDELKESLKQKNISLKDFYKSEEEAIFFVENIKRQVLKGVN